MHLATFYSLLLIEKLTLRKSRNQKLIYIFNRFFKKQRTCARLFDDCVNLSFLPVFDTK